VNKSLAIFQALKEIVLILLEMEEEKKKKKGEQ